VFCAVTGSDIKQRRAPENNTLCHLATPIERSLGPELKGKDFISFEL
jgi:hypothetical protein